MTTGEKKWCPGCRKETEFRRATFVHKRIGLTKSNGPGSRLRPVVREVEDEVSFCSNFDHPRRTSPILDNHTGTEDKPLDTVRVTQLCPGCHKRTVHFLLDIGPKDPGIGEHAATGIFICGRTRHPERVSRVTMGTKK